MQNRGRRPLFSFVLLPLERYVKSVNGQAARRQKKWIYAMLFRRIWLLWILVSLGSFSASAQEPPDRYLLNPGDTLQVSVWGEDGLAQALVVLPDGTIGFPLVGTIKVAGLTVSQAERRMDDKLSETIRSPRSSIVVTSVAGNQVYVIGRVNSPSAYTLQSRMTVPQLISMAGGFTEFAKESKVAILRRTGRNVERIPVDLDKLLKGQMDERAANFELLAGDVIVVP